MTRIQLKTPLDQIKQMAVTYAPPEGTDPKKFSPQQKNAVAVKDFLTYLETQIDETLNKLRHSSTSLLDLDDPATIATIRTDEHKRHMFAMTDVILDFLSDSALMTMLVGGCSPTDDVSVLIDKLFAHETALPALLRDFTEYIQLDKSKPEYIDSFKNSRDGTIHHYSQYAIETQELMDKLSIPAHTPLYPIHSANNGEGVAGNPDSFGVHHHRIIEILEDSSTTIYQKQALVNPNFLERLISSYHSDKTSEPGKSAIRDQANALALSVFLAAPQAFRQAETPAEPNMVFGNAATSALKNARDVNSNVVSSIIHDYIRANPDAGKISVNQEAFSKAKQAFCESVREQRSDLLGNLHDTLNINDDNAVLKKLDLDAVWQTLENQFTRANTSNKTITFPALLNVLLQSAMFCDTQSYTLGKITTGPEIGIDFNLLDSALVMVGAERAGEARISTLSQLYDTGWLSARTVTIDNKSYIQTRHDTSDFTSTANYSAVAEITKEADVYSSFVTALPQVLANAKKLATDLTATGYNPDDTQTNIQAAVLQPLFDILTTKGARVTSVVSTHLSSIYDKVIIPIKSADDSDNKVVGVALKLDELVNGSAHTQLNLFDIISALKDETSAVNYLMGKFGFDKTTAKTEHKGLLQALWLTLLSNSLSPKRQQTDTGTEIAAVYSNAANNFRLADGFADKVINALNLNADAPVHPDDITSIIQAINPEATRETSRAVRTLFDSLFGEDNKLTIKELLQIALPYCFSFQERTASGRVPEPFQYTENQGILVFDLNKFDTLLQIPGIITANNSGADEQSGLAKLLNFDFFEVHFNNVGFFVVTDQFQDPDKMPDKGKVIEVSENQMQGVKENIAAITLNVLTQLLAHPTLNIFTLYEEATKFYTAGDSAS